MSVEDVKHGLINLDFQRLRERAMADIRSGKKTRRAKAVKLLHAIEGFERSGIEPGDFFIKKVPIIPPAFRPFTVVGETFVPGDANELYADLIQAKEIYDEASRELGPVGRAESAKYLEQAAKAVFGYGESPNPKIKNRNVSGFLMKILGNSPKKSWVVSKLLSKPQDFVGRAVISPDPELGMDEIGLPEKMAWKLYQPYIQRRLVASGIPAARALALIKDQHPQARKAMEMEMPYRPVVYSRAPALHKFNVVAGYPRIVDGDNIRVNPFVTTGMNADYDGDTMGVHLPVLPETVREAKEKLLPSKMLFTIRSRDKVMPLPKQEQILGLFSSQYDTGNVVKVRDQKDALQGILNGTIGLSDELDFT